MLVLKEQGVGHVSNGLGGCAEDRWGIFPSHRESQRDGNKRGFVGHVGENNAQFGGVGGGELKPVETVGEVDLDEVHPTFGRISEEYAAKNALEGTTKLHSLHSSVGLCHGIDAVKGIVHNGARATGFLRNDADRAEAKVGHMCDVSVGEDHPKTFVDHVGHVITEEFQMFEGGLVWAALKTGADFPRGPRGVSEGDWGTVSSVMGQ